MRKLRTVLSMLLAVMMIAGILPTTVFAEEYGMIPIFEAAETETETGPIELVEIPEEEPEEPEILPEIEDIILPENVPELAELETAALNVQPPQWRMSADKKTVFIDKPVVTGGTGNYTYAYNLYNDQGQALNYFYSNDPAVAATFPGDCKAVMIIVVSDGVNQQIVYTDWFFIIGFEGKYGASVTSSDASNIRMTVRTPENMQYLGFYSNDTEAGMFTASQHSEVTSGVRVWNIALPNQNYAELIVKAGRDLGDMTYLEKVDVNQVDEGLTVQAPAWRMSADKKTVFIDRPVVSGGTGNYTYAYNLYTNQGVAVNYFYSSEPAVAATFPDNCTAVVIIVVSDGVDQKTVYTDWFQITGFSEDSDVIDSGKCGDNLTWTLDNNGLLYISGTGEMEDYFPSKDAPWLSYKDQLKQLKLENGVTSIGSFAFSGCSGFTGNLVIPNSVTRIGGAAFSECSGFTGNLVIPDGVTKIDDQTFYGCSGFTGSLVIPNSVKNIGGSAFSGCCGFTGSLVIPDGVNNIGTFAFYGCSGFNGSLTILSRVTYIYYYAFDGCGFSSFKCYRNSYADMWARRERYADVIQYLD